ncbi:flavodoxin-dependent (E)-4-hydroxy-3-methylbut-2-enyl-diphosphate synthase, partial [Emergencia timonensis]
AEKTEHPLHIGITEAGTLKRGKVKSAIGIGSLLLEGIGDTMRVSLTADPVEEVYYAQEILEAAGCRTPKVDLVSCPTCGRTKVELQALTEEVERRLSAADIRPGLKVAVMGCVVNGPGEAKEADFGVAGGTGKGVIFSKGEIVKTVEEKDIVDELMNAIEGK